MIFDFGMKIQKVRNFRNEGFGGGNEGVRLAYKRLKQAYGCVIGRS